MDKEEKLDQQIEGYLNGTLTQSEREAFETMLARDPEIAGKVKDLVAIDEGLKAVGMEEFRQDLKQWEGELKQVHTPAIGWKRYIAVAAVVTLIVLPAIYLFTIKKPTSEELFLAYYQPYEEMVTTRGNPTDSLGMLLADGVDAYSRGDYRQCTDLLESYLEQRPNAHRVALYLGIAQMEIDQQQSAEASFQLAQEDPVFRQQAQWYQALSYLKFNKSEKARAILQAISENGAHYRHAEAAQLLKELN